MYGTINLRKQLKWVFHAIYECTTYTSQCLHIILAIETLKYAISLVHVFTVCNLMDTYTCRQTHHITTKLMARANKLEINGARH